MFTKIDKVKLDNYFNELAKIYKKKSHGYIFEFILVGGASILVNYDFRDVTNDIDAYYLPSADIKDAIKIVSEKFNIDSKWINNDFQKTKSYSNKLSEFSTFYKSYKEIICVRTIKDEYLIAMKLMSGRVYKNDISDIVGIINCSRKSGNDITYEIINKAVIDLYGSWNDISLDLQSTLKSILTSKELDKLYSDTINEEIKSRQLLLDFNEKYEGAIKEANIDDILKLLNKKNNSFHINNHYKRHTFVCLSYGKIIHFMV